MTRLSRVTVTGLVGLAVSLSSTATLAAPGAAAAPTPPPPAAAPPAAAPAAPADASAAAPAADPGSATVKTIAPGQAVKPQEAEPELPPETVPDEAGVVQKSDAEKKKDAEVLKALEGNSPVELPGESYYFIGARYRGIILPKFMQNLFADGGKSVYINAFGPEFVIRKDGFEYNLSTWLAFYNVDDMAFKGKSDNKLAWELLSAKMQLLYVTSDFLWSHEFSPEVALNYGVGVGLGVVFGDLFRNQSYPTQPGQDPANYSKCPGPRAPREGEIGYDTDTGQTYCDDSNSHYGNYTEPNWANGGSKPIVFPWLTLQTGLRFKPSRNVVGRFDVGFGTSGFFFGIGADYGL